MEESMDNFFTPQTTAIAFGILFLVLAAYLFSYQRKQRALAVASKQWPSTEGAITASSVGTRTTGTSEAGGETDVANVSYSYCAGGKDYHSNRVVWGGNLEGGKVRAFVAANPIGGHVTVYYDPKNPESAILLRDRTGNIIFVLILSIVFLLLGVGSLWLRFFLM
jgi:Protein of unknown function (DUF3592)